MSTITIPPSQFTLHAEGSYTGRIVDVQDLGERETAFGTKLKLTVKIECDSANAEDGTPFTIEKWFTVSSHPKSALTQFRVMLLGRSLTKEEASGLDPTELLGRRCGYLVRHSDRDGVTYANIDNVWPVDDGPATTVTDDDVPF